MPDEMQLGMFLVDTREIKATLIKRIDQCVTNINLALTNVIIIEEKNIFSQFYNSLRLI